MLDSPGTLLPVAPAVQALKAAGDPSRLRILAILQHHELTVGELVDVVGQSQPRVSRHLKLLVEAGLLERHTEGTSAFYRLDRTSPLQGPIAELLHTLDPEDPDIERDAERLGRIRAARARRAAAYFEQVASNWDRMRSAHVPEEEIEAALIDLLSARAGGDFLDLGTGTGRILEIAAPHIRNGIGIDTSRDMLTVARDKLERQALHHCHVRHGDVYNLDLPAGTIDTAVLHHVLHFLDDPALAIAEAARTLRPRGQLTVVDFAPHGIEALRHDYEHIRLGFAHDEVATWCTDAGLEDVTATDFTPRDRGADVLTVTLWTATQRADAPGTYTLEVA